MGHNPSVDKDHCELREETYEDLQEHFKNPVLIHYIGMLDPPRPGVVECITTLEFRDFNPNTSRNALFNMRLMNWQEILWAIISIPRSEKHLMEKAADENGLRIANGIPTIISGDGFHRFPAEGKYVFTLENKPGHPVYKN